MIQAKRIDKDKIMIVNDFTALMQPGLRVKVFEAGVLFYINIESSTFDGYNTTVTYNQIVYQKTKAIIDVSLDNVYSIQQDQDHGHDEYITVSGLEDRVYTQAEVDALLLAQSDYLESLIDAGSTSDIINNIYKTEVIISSDIKYKDPPTNVPYVIERTVTTRPYNGPPTQETTYTDVRRWEWAPTAGGWKQFSLPKNSDNIINWRKPQNNIYF